MLTIGIVRCFKLIVNVTQNEAVCHDLRGFTWHILSLTAAPFDNYGRRRFNPGDRLMPHMPPEPFRIKTVERLKRTTVEERERYELAGHAETVEESAHREAPILYSTAGRTTFRTGE